MLTSFRSLELAILLFSIKSLAFSLAALCRVKIRYESSKQNQKKKNNKSRSRSRCKYKFKSNQIIAQLDDKLRIHHPVFFSRNHCSKARVWIALWSANGMVWLTFVALASSDTNARGSLCIFGLSSWLSPSKGEGGAFCVELIAFFSFVGDKTLPRILFELVNIRFLTSFLLFGESSCGCWLIIPSSREFWCKSCVFKWEKFITFCDKLSDL